MDVYSRAGVQSISVLTYNEIADLSALATLTAQKLGLARAAKSELAALL
jgi:hypothetical protein